jgi:hypothetical protein
VIYALDANVLVHATFADLPEYAPVHAFLEREVRQAGRTSPSPPRPCTSTCTS